MPKEGLEGVVAARSGISYIDGKAGKLIYRGYNIFDLAEQATFEEIVYLLWNGRLPSRSELSELETELTAHRDLNENVIEVLKLIADRAQPMEALRTAVSTLSSFDPDAEADTKEANRAKAARLVAKIPTIIAAFHRLRQDKAVIDPREDLGHAANFLYMLNGEEASPRNSRIFDVALVLHADHGFNASTFASRVTSGTLSDIYSAITSAVGTLKGPLHGGANQNVMNMLLEIDQVDNAEDYTKEALATGERVPGFGHRVYRTMDPRAKILSGFSRELGENTGDTRWFEMSTIIQDIVKQRKGLDPNVDFYSASTYYALGIPTDLFTPIFALSRVSGWTAHVLEQYDNNRLIRPRAEYTGEMDLTYVPIEER